MSAARVLYEEDGSKIAPFKPSSGSLSYDITPLRDEPNPFLCHEIPKWVCVETAPIFSYNFGDVSRFKKSFHAALVDLKGTKYKIKN